MTTRTYRTNLRCTGCVQTIAARLNTDTRIASWSADVTVPERLLRVESAALTEEDVNALLEADGYKVLGEVKREQTVVVAASEPPVSYRPLVLLVGMILAACASFEFSSAALEPMRFMRHFMAGFFLSFSFFKLLDVTSFAATYRMYDLVAARIHAYGYAYPFIEAALGLAYLANVAPVAVNVLTLLLMLVGTAGVVVSMLQKKKVKCACLGAVFNLPMSYVTLIEDASMAVMAAVMLAM